MSAPSTEHRSRARRLLDRFGGGQPKPPGRWGRAQLAPGFLLFPSFLHLAFAADEPVPWSASAFLPCSMLGGALTALSRSWHRRRRLAYGPNATGTLIWQAGMIVFIVGLGMLGEWSWFLYGLFVYGALTLLAATGMFHPGSSTRSEQREERG